MELQIAPAMLAAPEVTSDKTFQCRIAQPALPTMARYFQENARSKRSFHPIALRSEE